MLDYLEEDERQILLLGVRREVLIRVFGEPSLRFIYKGKELLHYGQPGLSYVEVDHGVVTRCEVSPERRDGFRVPPSRPTELSIVTAGGELTGRLWDLSVFGVSVTMESDRVFAPAEEVTVSFTIPISGVETPFSIPATFLKVSRGKAEGEEGRRVVFLLGISQGSEAYARLSRYVVERQMDMLVAYRAEASQ